jgi:hypothetical protein
LARNAEKDFRPRALFLNIPKVANIQKLLKKALSLTLSGQKVF